MSEFSLKRSLVRLFSALFLTYISVAMALPVVPLLVTGSLRLPNWLGGLAAGISFVSTIITRKHAGYYADVRSGKRCALYGIILYMVSAVICAVSVIGGLPVWVAFSLLAAGRLALGVGESFAMVGITNWHITMVGPRHSGKVLAAVGMAMYGAFAAGGPLGLVVYRHWGFASVMLVSFVASCAGLLLFRNSPETLPHGKSGERRPFIDVLGNIWKQGFAVCLQGVGFAVLGAFIPLYFADRGWSGAGYGLALFGSGFVLVRVFLGGLPDKIGGAKVAAVSLVVECAGQCLLWLSADRSTALAGALMTGLGCSMIFPSMGVEVIKRISPEMRATAFGGFTMFQDIAYAFAAPVAGALADHGGYESVFLFGTISAACGLLVVLPMFSWSGMRE